MTSVNDIKTAHERYLEAQKDYAVKLLPFNEYRDAYEADLRAYAEQRDKRVEELEVELSMAKAMEAHYKFEAHEATDSLVARLSVSQPVGAVVAGEISSDEIAVPVMPDHMRDFTQSRLYDAAYCMGFKARHAIGTNPAEAVFSLDIDTPTFQALLTNLFFANQETLDAPSRRTFENAHKALSAVVDHINSAALAAQMAAPGCKYPNCTCEGAGVLKPCKHAAPAAPLDISGLTRYEGESIARTYVFEKEEFYLCDEVQALIDAQKGGV